MPLLGGGYGLGAGHILGGGAPVGGGPPPPPPPSGAIEVAMDGKHPALIAVAMQFKDADGVTRWGEPQIFNFDNPLVALIQSISVRYLGTGEVIPHLIGDEDVVSIYGNVGIGSPPADPTAVAKDFTVGSGNGAPASTGKFARFGDVVYVAARGVDKNGVLGPVKLVAEHRGDAAKHAPRVHATAIRSGETATVTIEVDDPTKSVTSIMQKRREGNGAIDTTWQDVWDLGSTGVIGSDTYLKRVRAITTTDGLDGEFHFRIEFTNENGATEEIGDTIYLANLREVSKTVRIPAANFAPLNNTTAYSLTAAGLAGGNLGEDNAFLYGLVLPRGAEITAIRGRGYLQSTASGDDGLIRIQRAPESGGVETILATADFTTDGYNTYSASLSETVGASAYLIAASLRPEGSMGDAIFVWAEVDYDAPTYEFTI